MKVTKRIGLIDEPGIEDGKAIDVDVGAAVIFHRECGRGGGERGAVVVEKRSDDVVADDVVGIDAGAFVDFGAETGFGGAIGT